MYLSSAVRKTYWKNAISTPKIVQNKQKMTVTEETVTEESENEHWKYRSRLQTNFMGPSKM